MKIPFKIHAKYKPSPAQKIAIESLEKKYKTSKIQTLLGITGSGKTFVFANFIEKIQKSTLVLAHNKILAAQLYQELTELFPDNRVEYFISYYDYYQPESYIATTDTYIEKTATINKEIERLRLKTIASLMTRDDVIVVASISCIYGSGNPEDFKKLGFELKVDQEITRSAITTQFVKMLYERNNMDLQSGRFRVRGDTIDIVPGYEKNIVRIEMFGDEIEKISIIDKDTMEKIENITKIKLFPAKQFVVDEDKIKSTIPLIRAELDERLPELPLLESERLKKKVNYDIEMIEEVGYCNGIENYSRLFDGREPESPPHVLLDHFPKDFTLIIDESHQTLPQSRAMYKGDRARKDSLIQYGFRLPCAYDNRPLKFEEFEKYFKHTLFVSATPGPYEEEHSDNIAELIVRPTGLLDPNIEVKPIDGQVKDLIKNINDTTSKGERTLVTTLTKRMAEDLTDYLAKEKIKVRYMHSDIDSLDRIELIRSLRAGEFDVLVGINLLREGLDIPEVSLVTILDADKEGFLRDERSLIQTIGRAARNENGRVIMYADKMTRSMKNAIEKTEYRRGQQIIYNKKYNITPTTIIKKVAEKEREVKGIKHLGKDNIHKEMARMEKEMKVAANDLDFEKAINMRDSLEALKNEWQWQSGRSKDKGGKK
ncbi:MAG: excinuclease ABC subunit UvrB [Nanoarchaeales archaeon]|nr:excinuclease ABC subunit UvrB [Nanoarchaeales archaeon]